MPPFTTNKSFSPKLVWYNSKIKLKFNGSCLKQGKSTFIPKNVVNLFVVYELYTWSRDLNTDFTLKTCFLGAVSLTRNADTDNYKYSGYGIGFYPKSRFTIPNFDWGKNVFIFGVDTSSSVHVNN